MPLSEVLRIGVLSGTHGYANDSTIGMAIGYYAANYPNMIYDAATGEMRFSIYDTTYLKFDYNAGTPRVYLGGDENVVQITSNGLNVGTSGEIYGGVSGYLDGSGFWFGYDNGAYKGFIFQVLFWGLVIMLIMMELI